VKELVGPLTVSLAWKRGAGDDVEALLEVDLKPGLFSAEDARRYVDDVFPRLDARIAFPNVVQTAINEARFHAAAKEAEALLAQHPSPTWRSMLAYALAAAGLPSDAEAEGRKAMAEAPKDVVVRNRYAFALLHNARGIQFGRGYKRAEALAVIDGTLALEPENEWARRLRLNVLLFDESGSFVSDPKELSKLDVELSDYRKQTESPAMDDALIDVLLRQRDWQGLLVRLPKFPQTNQRDAAWIAADTVIKGDGAFQRAARDGRLNAESSGLAFQYLLLSREYGALGKAIAYLRDAESRSGRGNASGTAMAQSLGTVKRASPPPAGTVQATWMRFAHLIFTNATPAELREVIGGEVSDAELSQVRRVMRSVLGDVPRGAADVPGFSTDLFVSLGVFEQKTLPGFGELVTLRYKVPGFGPPTTQLMTKGPRGYQMRFDLGPAIAARCIERLQQGKVDEAREYFRAAVMLNSRAPAPLREERPDLELAGFVWTATQAVEAPNAAHVPRWLEAQLARPDIDEFTHGLVVDALQKWWKDQPEKRLALATQLGASPQPAMRAKALFVRLSTLTDSGRHKDALELVDQQLVSSPRDRRLLELKSDLLPKLGAWAKARELNRQLAADDPKREATFLNDAAWWALFAQVDEAAVQEIARVRQLSSDPSYVNTAACVYAAAGRYDLAAVELQAMVLNEQDREDSELGPASWFARGRVAEGFGRLETARALYKRVTREKKSSAADVWHLAQQRLEALEKR
jgi:tetratricopeptide (TPR) repeat protein